MLTITIVDVDNLTNLKNSIITAYGQFVVKGQRGYPLEGYEHILEAVLAVNYIEDYTVSIEDRTRIIEHNISSLRNAK